MLAHVALIMVLFIVHALTFAIYVLCTIRLSMNIPFSPAKPGPATPEK